MWLFTRFGFLSIVQHKSDPDVLLVRARDRGHLESFCRALTPRVPSSEILVTAQADYPFRLYATRKEVSEFIAGEVNTIGYTNFKGLIDSEVDRRPRDAGRTARYARTLHAVWKVVRDELEAARADARRRA